MSGIFGFSAIRPAADEKYLHALDVFNRTYGREGSGMYNNHCYGCGCHLEHFSHAFAASEPVIRRDRMIAVIDALLYNRDELLPLVNAAPSVSDEDLMLRLILEKGYEILSRVNGDFAGAIYDETAGTWTLFRDHSGVRPLFYYRDENLFAFSTDLRGLTALPGADLRANEKKLYERMAGYNDLSLCETEYENIRCIHPASWTVFAQRPNGFDMAEHIYWKWRQKKIRLKSDAEYQAELCRLITDSVKRRLDAVPGVVGCELSGGLDSSIIAILISRLGREGRFYSWSFSPEDVPMRTDCDERDIIFDICKQENISCHFAKRDLSRTVDDVLRNMTVPYMNTYALATGSQYVRSEGARVMFTGHGGDEGVSHRCNFYELWVHHEYCAFVRNIYRTTRGKKLRALRTIKRMAHQIFVEHPYFHKPFFKEYANASRFLSKKFVERMSRSVAPKQHFFAYKPYAYIMQGGHRVRLDNVSVQGAENGVRYLAPYIDYRVLDFALSIPRAQFHNGYTNRYIFRQAFDDIMPQSLRDMHYKDMPSQRDSVPDIDLRERFLDTHERVLKYFDADYWKEYLDVDAVLNYTIPEQHTLRDYVIASGHLNELMLCCLLQKLPIMTAEWCETHE